MGIRDSGEAIRGKKKMIKPSFGFHCVKKTGNQGGGQQREMGRGSWVLVGREKAQRKWFDIKMRE